MTGHIAQCQKSHLRVTLRGSLAVKVVAAISTSRQLPVVMRESRLLSLTGRVEADLEIYRYASRRWAMRSIVTSCRVSSI